MKLTSDLIEFIENVVRTGQSVKIDNLIIEDGVVRGMDEGRTVVMFHNKDVPESPAFDAIGLNRIGVYLARLDIVNGRDGFDIDAEVVDMNDVQYVKALHLKSADTKVDYRCASPESIHAPRTINDELVHRIQLNAEAVAVLQKGYAAMGSETVSIVGDDGVAFELEDINEDIFRHVFTPDSVQLSDTVTGAFSHKYPVQTLLALFKQNPDGYFEIGQKGILRITVNDIDLYVLPQV